MQNKHRYLSVSLVALLIAVSGTAFSLLRKAEQLQPDDLDVRLKLGLTCLNVAGFKQARDEAIYILERQPTNDEALLLLAETSLTPKDMDDMQQRLQKLASQIEKRPGLQLALGVLHLRRQDFTNAESEIKQAIALDPKSAAAHHALGSLYLARNDPEQAESAFKTGSDLAPIRSLRRLRYAEFKIQAGDLEAGKQILEGVTQKAPDYIPAWNRLAEIAFQQRKYDDCDKLIKRILARDAINYETLLLSGRVRLAKGEAARAVTEFERMSALYTRVPQLKYQLALAHLLNKDPARAVVSLNQAVALDSNYPE